MLGVLGFHRDRLEDAFGGRAVAHRSGGEDDHAVFDQHRIGESHFGDREFFEHVILGTKVSHHVVQQRTAGSFAHSR